MESTHYQCHLTEQAFSVEPEDTDCRAGGGDEDTVYYVEAVDEGAHRHTADDGRDV